MNAAQGPLALGDVFGHGEETEFLKDVQMTPGGIFSNWPHGKNTWLPGVLSGCPFFWG
jgi:hypothetical protein